MFSDDQYNGSIPIYIQIINKIKMRILTGGWSPRERIPAVRELAVEFGVNPNTMQRSLSELEREGLLYSERTAGRFITKDKQLIEQMRNQMANEAIEAFIAQMEQMGYNRGDIIQLLQK